MLMTIINTVDCQWYLVWLVRYKQSLWHISVSTDLIHRIAIGQEYLGKCALISFHSFFVFI